MLEGNECSRVLSAVDDLEQHLPALLKPFASYLRSFGAVQSSTFGLVPQPSWQADIANMKAQFQQVVEMQKSYIPSLTATQVHTLFGLRETPKIHLVLQHVPEFVR